jgi:hypothetical protein
MIVRGIVNAGVRPAPDAEVRPEAVAMAVAVEASAVTVLGAMDPVVRGARVKELDQVRVEIVRRNEARDPQAETEVPGPVAIVLIEAGHAWEISSVNGANHLRRCQRSLSRCCPTTRAWIRWRVKSR